MLQNAAFYGKVHQTAKLLAKLLQNYCKTKQGGSFYPVVETTAKLPKLHERSHCVAFCLWNTFLIDKILARLGRSRHYTAFNVTQQISLHKFEFSLPQKNLVFMTSHNLPRIQ